MPDEPVTTYQYCPYCLEEIDCEMLVIHTVDGSYDGFECVQCGEIFREESK